MYLLVLNKILSHKICKHIFNSRENFVKYRIIKTSLAEITFFDKINSYSTFSFVVFNQIKTTDEYQKNRRRRKSRYSAIHFRDKARRWKEETRCKNQAAPEIKKERPSKLVPSLFSLLPVFLAPSLPDPEANQITIHFVDRQATIRLPRSRSQKNRDRTRARENRDRRTGTSGIARNEEAG